MYALIFGSKLKSARQFKHWVTSEVLPSIRKTGSYSYQNNNQNKYSSIIVQPESNTHLPEQKNKWFFEHEKEIYTITLVRCISISRLYHYIIKEITKKIDWEQAKSIYILERGYKPKYAMDMVEYFREMREIADEFLENEMNLIRENQA